MKKSLTTAMRFRVMLDNGRALGPGKADMLDAILIHGSIAAAGRALGMSYKRAWYLVDDLNKSFTQPVVHATKAGGGGATLTETGRSVLAAYRTIEVKARSSAMAELRELYRLTERS